MSHEFKTPIATINLALDAISNPKVSKTPQKILKYVKTIREENIRMLSQVRMYYVYLNWIELMNQFKKPKLTFIKS